MKRSDLPDNVFGIPEERKYPMPDKKHTLSAIKLFGHVEDKYEKELANNIIKNMKKFNISNDAVGENNKLKKYLKEGYQEEDTFIVDESLLLNNEDETIEEGTFNQIIMQLPIQKYNIQHKTPINNIVDLVKYHKNPGLDNYVTKCNDTDDLSYLRRDTRSVIPTLNKIRDRITDCKKGETNKNKGYYNYIKKKYLDNDLSEKDVDLTLTWVKDVCNRITNKIKQLNKGITTEASKINRKRLYHLSQSNLDKKTINPRVPSNYFTKNGYEDATTPRVCFSSSIDGCLRGLSENLTGKEFFVHIPDGKYDIFAPTKKEVPDCKVTHEVWIKEPVKIKCVGKIKVIADKGEDGLPYTYGDGKKAELYDWEWNWIEKINEVSLEEAVAGIGTIVGRNNCEPIYIVNYMQNNVFSGSHQERFGICKSGMKDLHIIGGRYNRLHYTDLDEFEKEAEDIKVYRYTGNINKPFYSIIEDAENDLDFYTMLTGQSITNRSDIEKNIDFVRETYIRDELSAIQECIYATAMADTINEAYIKNEPDIYYNKDKFDNGEINLCFITGQSGSGKSTMGGKMEKDNKAVTHYQIDDVMANYNFSDNNLKEYGNLIYSYFNGPGKKYRFESVEEFNKNLEKYEWTKDFFTPFIQSFIDYSMKYADSHKGERIIIDGIQIYFYKQLSKLTKYAVYIKGTSATISAIRAAKRDTPKSGSKIKDKVQEIEVIAFYSKHNIETEKILNKFRKYFSNLVKQSSNESTIIDESSSFISYEIPLLGINEDGRSYNYYRDLDGVYAKNELTGLRCKSYDSVEDISEAVINLVKKGIY